MIGVALVVAAALAVVAGLDRLGDADPPVRTGPPPTDAQTVAVGAVLATAGNCIACHTARGGAPFAGGRPIATPFGTVFSANLTPDAATGLGHWSADDLRRALHLGRSLDGRRLLPACPFPQFTRLTPADTDALHAWLRTLAPVAAPRPPHELRFPYDQAAAMAVWRAVHFRPARTRDDASRPADWNRGRYLVQGVAHCAACHAERGWLGASRDPERLGGGMMPGSGWVAPSLRSPHEAGVAHWPAEAVVALLRDGIAPTVGAGVAGPMADVVWHGTRHLPERELAAMAAYLRTLPQDEPPPKPAPAAAATTIAAGRDLYARHCADCHGSQGEGHAGAYPALAGNRAVTQASPANLLKVILQGGFPPATAGHPRPYGMPPFGWTLADDEIAAVATFVRQAWGTPASEVTRVDVLRAR
jgi:mono/diheme cytochrome c family protein